MYSSGDSGDPCGTPAGVGMCFDFAPLNRSCVLRPWRKLVIHNEITWGEFGKVCQEHLTDTNSYLTKFLHQDLRDRFNFRPEDLVNPERFKFHYEDSNPYWSGCEAIKELRHIVDYTTVCLGLSPISSEPAPVWFPSNFEDVDRYTFESCMQDTSISGYSRINGFQYVQREMWIPGSKITSLVRGK